MDPDPTVRSTTAAMVEVLGFNASSARDLRSHLLGGFTVVIADCESIVSQHEAYARLTGDNVAVIAACASATTATKLAALRKLNGCRALTKPLNASKLLAELRYVRDNQADRAPAGQCTA